MFITLNEARKLVDVMEQFQLKNAELVTGEPNGICTEVFVVFGTTLREHEAKIQIKLTEDKDW